MSKKIVLLVLSAIVVSLLSMSCTQAFDTASSTDLNKATDSTKANGLNTQSLENDPAPTYAQDVICDPKNDVRWVNSTSTTLDIQLLGVKIVAYRIQWFADSWSAWYVPGVNDLYQKPGETLRRAWACFNDHTHQYLYIPAANASSLRSYSEFNRKTIPTGIADSGVTLSSYGPSNNTAWYNSTNINIDRAIDKKMIVAYKLTWLETGTESEWIIPGYFDIYQKTGENQRRWWACFNDHDHEYLSFIALC